MTIYQQAQLFRQQLLQRDTQALLHITNAYLPIYVRLQTDLHLLMRQIEAAQASGETISKAWLFRQERYQNLLVQIAREIDRYAQGAVVPSLTHEQRILVNLAQEQAGQMITGQTGDITASFNRLPASAVEQLVGFAGDGTPLNKMLRGYGRAVAGQVRDRLVEGIALGQGIHRVSKDVATMLDRPRWEAARLVRTESLRSYREASRATYQQSGIVQKWRWLAAHSSRTCAACLALDGHEFPIEKPMPAHPNCLIPGTQVLAPPLKGATKRWYTGEVIEIQTFGGHKLTVTPNHPILTPQGWIAASLLNEGDYVLSSDKAERVLATIYPDDNHIPAPIEQIAQTFRESLGVSASRVPAAPEYFHGDGFGSEVEIVYTDRLLWDGFHSQRLKHSCQFNLISRDAQLLQFARFCALRPLSLTSLSPPYSGVRRSSVSEIFISATGLHHYPISFDNASPCDALSFQDASDYLSRDLEAVSDGFFGFSSMVASGDFGLRQEVLSIVPDLKARLSQQSQDNFIGNTEFAHQFSARYAGLVKLDQIRKLSKRAFSGHVYNLDTELGWYLAEGIITHNCRCTVVPVVDGVAAPKRETGAEWLARQSKDVQASVLGEQGAEAFRNGAPLTNWVGATKSKQWGEARYKRSTQDALKGPQKGAVPPAVPPPATTKPAPKPKAKKPGDFPDDVGQLEFVRPLGGSTGAELVRDPVSGKQFVRKRGASPKHLREEFTADQAYRALGVPVPKAQLFETSDGPVKLAEYITGQPLSALTGPARAKAEKALRKHFAADALLGNWDVVGLAEDNILVDAKGKVWRIDNGGALRYRAMGEKKTAGQWNEQPAELWSMRDRHVSGKAGKIFGQIELHELPKQAQELAKRRAHLLKALPAELRPILGKRLDNLVEISGDWERGKFKRLASDEVNAWSKRESWKAWESGLTNEEREALRTYTGSSYTSINRFLRGLKESSGHENIIPLIDSAIEKGTVEHDLISFRGLRNWADLYNGLRNGGFKLGAPITGPGFSSSSIDTTIARKNFAGRSGAYRVVYEIRVRKGSRAAYIGDYKVSGLANEKELLLPRGSKLRVDRIREENGLIVVDVLLDQR